MEFFFLIDTQNIKCYMSSQQLIDLYNLYVRSSGVSTDTRNIASGNLFFALRGDSYNGNEFAQRALEQGALAAVVDDPAYFADGCVLVDNVLLALQQLAQHHRQQLRTKIVGITGTNGKTTTKELLAAVLGTRYRTVATRGNLNNHIGVPLTLLGLTPEVEVAVVEMGANHLNDIEELVQIAQPNYGLITNIGRAHLAGFGSLEGVVQAKTALYRYLAQSDGVAFYNSDNKLLDSQIRQCGVADAIAYRAVLDAPAQIFERDGYMSMELSVGGVEYCIDTQLVGRYNAENVLAALAVGIHLGVPAPDAVAAIAAYIPSNNRSQRINTARNTVIMDAYNANPSSMAVAIEAFASAVAEHKVAILGQMLELGDSSLDEHRRVVEQLKACNFDEVMLVGECFAHVDAPYQRFASAAECAALLEQHPIKGATVLLKGSRGVGLERLLPLL